MELENLTPADQSRPAVTPPRRVSVCVATYNGSAYVVEQLSSVLSQLDVTDEVVIVDDCSTDDTVEQIETLSDPRIRLIRAERNAGYVASFERALGQASGDVVLLCDQDDVWLPGRVALMRSALADALVVAGNLTTLGGPEAIPGPYGQSDWRLRSADSRRRWRNTAGILAGNRPYFGSAMGLRREALRLVLPFPSLLVESHDLWIAICGNQAGSIVHLEAALTARRYHDSNQTPERPRDLSTVLRARLMLIRAVAQARRRLRQEPR